MQMSDFHFTNQRIVDYVYIFIYAFEWAAVYTGTYIVTTWLDWFISRH